MALLIARHGETALNVAGIIQPADTPLSERGEQQSVALGRRLARDHRVVAVVSSDLPRAIRTAELATQQLTVRIEAHPAWQERNFGALRGRTLDSMGFDPLTMREAPEAGESLAQFEARVAKAWVALWARLQSLAPDEDLLLVTHGLVVRAVLATHIEDGAQALLQAPPPNASLAVISSDRGRPRLLLGPCAAHWLSPGARHPGSAAKGV
jgi:broad specificity phosphatase PhoE